MNHVDPPDLGLWPTLRRLFPLWWEQRRLVGIGLAFALAFTTLSITIPILIKRVIDEAIVGPHDDRLLPYLGADRRARHAALRRQLLAPVRDRPGRDRRRGAAARDALPRLPHLPAGVLRPARDRRGDLARDERHLPGALLHRLGRRPGSPERDDDHGRRDRPHGRERPARALRRARDAPDRRPDLVLRPQALPDLAARPGEEGPSGRGDRRGGRRDRDGAGLRPRGRRADALPRARRGGPPRDDAGGLGGGVLPPRPALPAVARDRRRAPLRRARGDRGRADDRRVHALHHAAAAARLAARGARLDHQPRPARGRVGRAELRVAGRDRAAARAGRAEAAPGRAAARPLRGRPLRVRDRGRGAAGRRPRRRAGRDRRRLRPDRLGQDDAAQPAPPLLRPDRRPRPRRRRRHARRPGRASCAARSRS